MPRKVENAKAIVAAVSNYPLLYTNDRAAYKKSKEKNLLWVDVARNVFGKTDMRTVERTKIQWKSIRDAYVKYQKKRLICPKIRPYVYEKDMEFLLPQVLETFNKSKVTKNYFISPGTPSELRAEDSISISSCSDSNDIEEEEEEKEEEEYFEEEEEEEEPFEEITIEYINKEKSALDLMGNLNKMEAVKMENDMFHTGNQCKREQSKNVNASEVVEINRIYDIYQNKIEHPVDAFFYGIAQTVKQLKPSTISSLKKTITNIVLDAESKES